jgi:hypothetical protein
MMPALAPSTRFLWRAVRARSRSRDDEQHVRSAVAWLGAAQAAGGGGFAHSFHLLRGWERAYPETTGYILPSLRRADARFRIAAARPLLENAARWLASVQQPDGSFLDLAGAKQIFDTGQILHGWNDLAEHLPALVAPERHRRAARWIAGEQESDGSFVLNTWGGAARSYYVRVGAALMRAGRLLGEAPLVAAGRRNIDWTLAQQEPNGYFRHMSFDDGPPFLHTILYVVEGLIEAHAETGAEAPLAAALRLTEQLREAAERDSLPRSRYRPDFAAVDRELCLPGLAQWAGACFRLVALGFPAYAAPGRAAVAALKRRQIVSAEPGLDGGLFGSAPFWGRYMRFAVPNWGVKFLIDALLAHAAEAEPL